MAFEEMSGPRTTIRPKQVFASFDARSSPAGIPSHRTSASLLKDTPPSIIVALSQLAPIVRSLNTLLGLVTWTGHDHWSSFLLLSGFWVTCLYGDLLFHYAGNWLLLLCLSIGYMRKKTATRVIVEGIKAGESPLTSGTLDTQKVMDSTLYEIDCLRARYHLLSTTLAPIHGIFAWEDPKRSALIGMRLVLVTPLYVAALWFFTNRALLLCGGTLLLTCTSPWFRVICTVCWRLKTVRKVVSALIGVDYLPGESNIYGVFSTSTRGEEERGLGNTLEQKTAGTNHPMSLADDSRFTTTIAVIENQRRWLGIGWTPSLLPHERAPFTDLEDRPGAAPENTALPLPKTIEEDGVTRTVTWHWIDPDWRIETDRGRDAEGWLYFDNAWRNPTLTEEIGRYTRRRKWIRNAECLESVHESEGHKKQDLAERDGSRGTGAKGSAGRTLDPEKVKVSAVVVKPDTSSEKDVAARSTTIKEADHAVGVKLNMPKREWRQVEGGGRELVAVEAASPIRKRPFTLGRKSSRASVVSVGID